MRDERDGRDGMRDMGCGIRDAREKQDGGDALGMFNVELSGRGRGAQKFWVLSSEFWVLS